MSHHLDSPAARQDVRLDITDLYVFAGQTGTVLVLNVCHSAGGQVPVPGFHPEGRYEFKIDLNEDAVEDLTYRVFFETADTTGSQRFTVYRLSGGAQATDREAAGEILLSGRTGASTSGTGGVRAWAGKAGDPFWIEPTVLHAMGHAIHDGTAIDLGRWNPEMAYNLFAGATVYSLVLELPHQEMSDRTAHNRIGVWAVSSLATDAGGWQQINRVGLPMLPPLFTQFDGQLGDALNTGHPSDDYQTYGDRMAAQIAAVVAEHDTASDPAAYGQMVARRILPNILPYTVGTAAVFGFAGWNGRSLVDDVPAVMFSLAANKPVSLGIGSESVTVRPRSAFPYVPEVR